MPTKRKPKLGSECWTRIDPFQFTPAQREALDEILINQNRKKWPAKWPDSFIVGLESICGAWLSVSSNEKPSETIAGLDILLTRFQELTGLLDYGGSLSLGVEVHDAIVLGTAKARLAYHKHSNGEGWQDLRKRLFSDLNKATLYLETALRDGTRLGKPHDWAKTFLVQQVEALFREYGYDVGAAEGAPFSEVIRIINGTAGRLTRRTKLGKLREVANQTSLKTKLPLPTET